MNTEPSAVLRPQAAAKYIGVSIATFWRFTKDSTFPKTLKLGVQSTGVLRSELDAWLKTRRDA